MTAIKSIYTVAGLAAVALCACSSSSSSGSSVDFAALQTQYTKPTGSLGSKTDVTSAASQYSKGMSQSTGLGSTVGALGTKLHNAGGVKIQGGSLTGDVSEPCPGGGSADITGINITGTSEQATVDYNSCVEGSETISGSLSFQESESPELFIYSGSVTITPPGTTVTLDFAEENGEFAFSATIATGNVVVSESGGWDPTHNTGTITITDSKGTWTCNVMADSGSCTGPGKTITWK